MTVIGSCCAALTPSSYNAYDRYAIADIDQCKSLCEIGVLNCRENCDRSSPEQLHLDVHDAAASASLQTCNAIAFGITESTNNDDDGCVIYSDIVMSDTVQA
eukprot:SAG31_NODE_3555_length_4129_cov_1.868734_5_plen_102_part_00